MVLFFFLMIRRPPRSTLFPYTTLFRSLLSATKVLRSKYGRITIRAGEPISLAQLFRERGVDPETCTPEEKKKIVQHLGWKIAAGINAAAPLAPTGLAAAVLLSHDRRAPSATE